MKKILFLPFVFLCLLVSAQSELGCKFCLPSPRTAPNGYVLTDSAGFARWQAVGGGGAGSFWKTTGNSGTDPSVNFIGTTDNQPLMFRINNNYWGRFNSDSNIIGIGNVATNLSVGLNQIGIGNSAGNSVVGNDNIGIGNSAGNSVVGFNNLGIGLLASNGVAGGENIGIGTGSLNVLIGDNNIGIGASAIYNGYGSNNVAIGGESMYADTSSYSIGIGFSSMYSNRGDYSIGIGAYAGHSNIDAKSLYINISGVNGDSTTSIIYGSNDLGKVKINAALQVNDGTQSNGYVLTSDANGVCHFESPSSSDYSGIPAYANNAAAFAVLGAGKLYYTDVAGEYILKVTH